MSESTDIINNSEPDFESTPAVNISERATVGFAWAVAETLSGNIVGIVSQVVLAWLLMPQDLGLVGLVYTVTWFTNLINDPGIFIVLIHRQREFNRYANPAFWLAIATSLSASIVLLAIAPLAAGFYRDDRLVGLLWVMALAGPLNNLSLVCCAKVNINMQFGALAKIGVLTTLGTMVLSVILAWAGFGPYSIIIPLPVFAVLRSLIYWYIAPCKIRWNPQFKLWRYLYGDTVTMFACNLLLVVILQGDYIILGYYYDAALVGIYYMAFNLSMKVMQIFQGNVSRVLMPALSAFHGDQARQNRGLLKSVGLLALGATPFAVLQAGLADPVLHLMFQPKWWPAIPILQVLSLGMAVRVIGSPALTMLQAQGRFRTLLQLNAASACLFVAVVLFAVQFGQGVAVAIGESLYFLVMGPLNLYVATHCTQTTWKDILRPLVAPFLAAVLSVGSGVLLSMLIQPTMNGMNTPWLYHTTRIVIILTVGLFGYWFLIKNWQPTQWQELCERFTSLVHKIRRSQAAPTLEK